ncbi:hypothetical protein KDU71_17395 [Carboxylicivirga sediminis]|uniref:DUF3157 family protein n=1 Tax=Carboxylicivirga sediminis TaxID=2006564 RepID=A0A941IXZ0_9BACT|nr:hypothetical protein [Carboxylicivirga sediminis]MBR8537346.1 hypothetical protein [Carboxylicivirga sediminis]
MKHLFILLILLTATCAASAQTIKAITQYGETVVLYENGTWKYEKDLENKASQSQVDTPVTVAPVATTPKVISVDDTKNTTSEKVEIMNAVSKKLARFFGEEKGRIRCSASATNNNGEVFINFEFMMPLGDANRYFGYTAEERTVHLILSNGAELTNTFTHNIEEKFIDKWNVSYYKASILLSKEDIAQLLINNTMRLKVDWKKIEEEYTIDNIEGIKTILTEVI